MPVHCKPKILCIDDDPEVATAIRLRLEHYDCDVLSACDGTDGFWLAVNEAPHVIITDLRMPNGDGDYLIECLKGRADTSDIPVITLTGRRDPEIERWMLTLGVEDYLHKPPRWNKLLDAIRKYIPMQTGSAD